MEEVEEEDHDLLAHLAGEDEEEAEEPDMFVNLAGDNTEPSAVEGDESTEDDDGVYRALAVAGLESLNLWAA